VIAEMNPAEYHVPLAMFFLIDAMRLSGRVDEVVAISQFKGDLILESTVKAHVLMAELVKRDGELGLPRAATVLRISGRLSNLSFDSVSSLARRHPAEYWTWLDAQRTIESSSFTKLAQFFDALRLARQKD